MLSLALTSILFMLVGGGLVLYAQRTRSSDPTAVPRTRTRRSRAERLDASEAAATAVIPHGATLTTCELCTQKLPCIETHGVVACPPCTSRYLP